MKIAQFAPIWIPVPPRTYGGTEFVVSEVTDGLLARGHDVTLFASGDSTTKAKLISPWPVSLWRAKLGSPHAVWSLHLSNLLEHQDEFDVIHNHCGFYIFPLAKYIKKPIITTLHRPLAPENYKVYTRFPDTYLVPISKDQMESAPKLRHVRLIYNGIPTERFPFNASPQDYLLWISKIIPEKGILEAIRTAKLAGKQLKIAGNIVGEENQRFFKYEIQPLIDGDQIQYVGEADFDTKIGLFRNAKALLCPFTRREPFGLVMTEAMACGTPVIGFGNGAIPEIVEDGVTGFIVKSVEEMAEAVGRLGDIKRSACRQRVEDNFSVKRMIDEYEDLCLKLANGGKV